MIDLTAENPAFELSYVNGVPMLRPRASEMGAAAGVLNDAVAGLPPYRDFAERLERREDVYGDLLGSVRLAGGEDITPDTRAWWRKMFGVDLDQDTYTVFYGEGLTPQISFLPRAVLLDWYRQLLNLRLRSTPFWLFRPWPIWWQPAPGERAHLEQLENRAARDDTAGRSALVRDLANAGIFSTMFFAERDRLLREWNLPALESFRGAGLALNAYLSSYSRAAAVGLPPPVLLPDAPVDLEIFRDPTTPWPAEKREDWLARVEAALHRLNPRGDSGVAPIEIDGVPLRLGWRRDSGVLRLTSIAQANQ